VFKYDKNKCFLTLVAIHIYDYIASNYFNDFKIPDNLRKNSKYNLYSVTYYNTVLHNNMRCALRYIVGKNRDDHW